MDNHSELSHQESESESGSSYAGSDLSPDRAQFPQISSKSRSKQPDHPNDHEDQDPTLSRQNELRSDTDVNFGAQGGQDSLIVDHHSTSTQPAAHNEHTSFQSSHFESVPASASMTSEERSEPRMETFEGQDEVAQPQSSTSQSPYNALDLESSSRLRSASASTPTLLSSTRPSHDGSSELQSSATIVPVPGPGSPPRPTRDGRDIVLPRWQPDAEVTYCPICRTQFSFFVRKHHCRYVVKGYH